MRVLVKYNFGPRPRINTVSIEHECLTLSYKENPSDTFQTVDQAIVNRQYERALQELISIRAVCLEKDDKEQLAICLDLIDSVCDKSDETIQLTLHEIDSLLDHSEYWVRQAALLILKKIFKVIPNEFQPYIERIEAKLFDVDKKVRETAINLIGSMLTYSLTRYSSLYLSYSRMFEDKSWMVRARALEGVLKFISPETVISQDIINAFMENIEQLLSDPDEEVRGLAAEVLKILCFHMDPARIIKFLDPILHNGDWEIREKGIWIVGEIGR